MHSAVPRVTLMPLSCSPNFPHAQYFDICMLTHELIVKYDSCQIKSSVFLCFEQIEKVGRIKEILGKTWQQSLQPIKSIQIQSEILE